MPDFITKLWKTATVAVDDTSKKNTLNKTDTTKTLRTAILLGLSAGLTAFVGELSPDMLNSVLFFVPENMQNTVATLLVAILGDLGMRFKKDNK